MKIVLSGVSRAEGTGGAEAAISAGRRCGRRQREAARFSIELVELSRGPVAMGIEGLAGARQCQHRRARRLCGGRGASDGGMSKAVDQSEDGHQRRRERYRRQGWAELRHAAVARSQVEAVSGWHFHDESMRSVAGGEMSAAESGGSAPR